MIYGKTSIQQINFESHLSHPCFSFSQLLNRLFHDKKRIYIHMTFVSGGGKSLVNSGISDKSE